jgi:hypothetical protein
MPDDNIQVNDNKPENNQVNDGQVDDNKDVKPQTESEFMEDTVDFIKTAQKSELGEDDDTASDDSEQGADDSGVIKDLAGTDIPDAFSEAAEATGMTPAEIIALADRHTNEELMEMIPELKAALEGPDEDDDVTIQDDKQDKDDGNKDIDPKLVESITNKISKQLEEKFGATLDEIDKFKAYQQEQSERQATDTASKMFDEASKEFPVFGKTDKLPRFSSGRLAGQVIRTSPEMKARLEVLRYADAFMSQGDDIDNAMAKALGTYKGMHLEKELERKQVRDLKQHETKLSGARVGRETKKKYADTRDEIIDDIRQMQRAAGVD